MVEISNGRAGRKRPPNVVASSVVFCVLHSSFLVLWASITTFRGPEMVQLSKSPGSSHGERLVCAFTTVLAIRSDFLFQFQGYDILCFLRSISCVFHETGVSSMALKQSFSEWIHYEKIQLRLPTSSSSTHSLNYPQLFTCYSLTVY
jgi:hypothetical protein